MARRWTCRNCKTLNQRTASRRCVMCGKATKPKTRVPKHAITLRDDPYERYREVSAEIHGVADESCCVCGRERSLERRHDRDHDHVSGHPRGLCCVLCNKLMPRQLTLAQAELIVAYLRRVDAFYGSEAQAA